MIKSILSTFFAVTLSLVISIVIFPAYPVMAQATIYVPDDYTTIQEAIDAALPGDTVYVGPGTYDEYLSIDKSLTLTGEDRDTTIIEAPENPNFFTPTIDIKESNVTISNLTIRSYGVQCVNVDSFNNISLINNNIYNLYLEGVFIQNSSGINLVDNDIQTDGTNNTRSDGVYINGSASANLEGNNIHDSRNGMYLENLTNSNIQNNTISNSGLCGIWLGNSDGNNIEGNTLNDSGKHGIYLDSSNGNTFTGNTIFNNTRAGIFFVGSSNNKVYNNNFINNLAWQVYISSGQNNIFNLAKAEGGGNYWSDHTSPDGDGDGFVDSPYEFGGGQDNFPWVLQDGWLQNQPPDEITVLIDIKPGSDPNSINLGAKGVVPVAVLTTADFDATTVKPDTVVFASAEPQRWTAEDVDGDGDLDLLFHFKTQELDLTESSTEATLTGQTLDDDGIAGADSVRIVPSKNKK